MGNSHAGASGSTHNPKAELSSLPETFDRAYFEDSSRRESCATSESDVSLRFRRYARFTLERFHPRVPKLALDIGCAKGYLLKSLQELGVPGVGVDVSDYALKNAEQTVRGTLTQSASEFLPFKSGTFDIVTMIDVAEHLQNPPTTFKEIARVLSPDGLALVSTISPRHPSASRDTTHINVHELSYWERAARDAGLVLSRERIELYDEESVSGIPPGTVGKMLPGKLRQRLLLKSMRKRMAPSAGETYYLLLKKE